MGGGLGNWTNLGTWSATLPVNLWRRFDHPGVYTLYVWSNRVQKGAHNDSRDFDRSADQVILVSDPIKFTIDPLTPQKEQAVLDEARKVIAKPDSGFLSVQFRPNKACARTGWEKLCLSEDSSLQLPYLLKRHLSHGICRHVFKRSVSYLGCVTGARPVSAEAPFLLAEVAKGRPLLNEYATEIYAALKTPRCLSGGFPCRRTEESL